MDDPRLGLMAQIAQPLDEWCAFDCGHLAVMKTADGVPACSDCAKGVLAAIKKYEKDAAFLARQVGRRAASSGGKAKARAKRRAKRKRTKR